MENSHGYSTDMIIQYSIVGIILLAAFGWILWKMLRKQKKMNNSCCGCAISETCQKKEIIKNKKKHDEKGCR